MDLGLDVMTGQAQGDVGSGFRALAFDAACGLAGGLLVAITVSFTLPVLEWMFGVLTDIRLLELSNLNSPLLRRLAVRAPGTYNHSVIVGNEYSDHSFLSFELTFGTLTVTDVPCPGIPWKLTAPPQERARSCMPTKPNEVGPEDWFMVMPRPLSRTTSTNSSESSRSSTHTFVASA